MSEGTPPIPNPGPAGEAPIAAETPGPVPPPPPPVPGATPPMPPAASEAPKPQAGRGRKAWSTTAKVVTWTISIVSFVTGIIAVVPILTRNASNFDALMFDVLPYPASATSWAVDPGADFGSFPSAASEVCSAEQRTWLEANGAPITTHVLVDMRNTAGEGAMITVKDFRVSGESSDAERSVRVVCDTAAPTSVRVQAARLDASGPGNVAVFAAAAFGAVTTEGLPDTPAAWNLAPGETGQMIVQLFGSNAVDGTLQATVLNAAESRDLTLGDDGGLSIRPLVDDGRTYLRAGSALTCLQDTADGEVPCDTAAFLLAAGDQP